MTHKLLGLLLILFSACSQSTTNDEIVKIDIPEESTNYETFFQSFKFEKAIPLQTSDDYVVSNIRRLIIDDSLVFILNGYQNVFVFNQIGSFLRHIGEVGKGPGEYRQLIDIATDSINKKLFLYSDDYRILEYSYEGDFLSQSYFDNQSLYRGIQFVNGNLYFYKESVCPDGSLLSVLDGKIINSASSFKTCDFPVSFNGESFVKSKTLLFTQTSSNVIYEFDGENTKQRFLLNIPHFITDEDREKYNQNRNVMDILTEVYKKSMIYDITSIRETKDGIFLKTNLSPLIWIKPNYQEVCRYASIIDFSISKQPLRYYAHDGADDYILFVAEGSAVAEREKQNDIPALESKLATMTDQSNPILLFYKLKN